MTNEQIKKIFLLNGFKEKQQPNGEVDLNPYVYEAARALLDSRWISVEDRLPETDVLFNEYLVYDTLNNHVNHDYWNNEHREWNYYQGHVTHWQPLPKSPIGNNL